MQCSALAVPLLPHGGMSGEGMYEKLDGRHRVLRLRQNDPPRFQGVARRQMHRYPHVVYGAAQDAADAPKVKAFKKGGEPDEL